MLRTHSARRQGFGSEKGDAFSRYPTSGETLRNSLSGKIGVGWRSVPGSRRLRFGHPPHQLGGSALRCSLLVASAPLFFIPESCSCSLRYRADIPPRKATGVIVAFIVSCPPDWTRLDIAHPRQPTRDRAAGPGTIAAQTSVRGDGELAEPSNHERTTQSH